MWRVNIYFRKCSQFLLTIFVSKSFGWLLNNEVLCHLDNCYKIENLRCNGKVYKTNRTSTMAMRGAGTPQGTSFCEFMFEDIALKLGLNPTEFREKHLVKTGDHNSHHQKYENTAPLYQAWKELKEERKLAERLEAVKIFNSQNKYKKRGVSLIPIRYSVGITSLVAFAQGTHLLYCNTKLY